MAATEKAQGIIQTKPSQPNIPKYFSYKLAHDQIKRAIGVNPPFPIEAIAIEESILSDRLYSALVARLPDKAKEAKRQGRGKALFGTILAMIANPKTFAPVPEFFDLNAALARKGGIKSLFDWKQRRNSFVHGLARSPEPCQPPEIGSDAYFVEGLAIARKGVELVKTVKSWSTKSIRAARTATSGKA